MRRLGLVLLVLAGPVLVVSAAAAVLAGYPVLLAGLACRGLVARRAGVLVDVAADRALARAGAQLRAAAGGIVGSFLASRATSGAEASET